MLNGSSASDYSPPQLKRNKIGAAPKLISNFNKFKYYFQDITEFNQNLNSEKIIKKFTSRSITYILMQLLESISCDFCLIWAQNTNFCKFGLLHVYCCTNPNNTFD